MRLLLRVVLTGFLLHALIPGAKAGIELPALFSDHAVLQRSSRTPVWGEGTPGERIKIALTGKQWAAVADESGRWRVDLDLGEAPAGPHVLEVTGSGTTRTIRDVMIGEVWLGSGQSNMEWVLRDTTDSAGVIAGSENSAMRFFWVNKNASADPARDVQGAWKIAVPDTTPFFPAIGYYFSRALHERLGAPVGFISASWGGTRIEGWISRGTFEAQAELAAAADAEREYQAAFPKIASDYEQALRKWAELRGRWVDDFPGRSDSAPSIPSEAAWKTVHLPGRLAQAGFPDAGVFILRRRVAAPAEMGNLMQRLDLGKIPGFCEAYVEGERVGQVTPRTGALDPVFYVKDSLIRSGTTTVMVRIYNPFGGAGIGAGRFHLGKLPLEGGWDVLVEKAFPAGVERGRDNEAPPVPPRAAPPAQQTPGYLFDGMIRPVTPYGIRGVVWYQGESDVHRAPEYRRRLPLLIADWRSRWGRGDFPFLICQLANVNEKASDVGARSMFAELREAQSAALAEGATGMAVLIDVGEELDIHARNKRDPGERLAKLALARTYGMDLADSGPVFKSFRVESDGGIRVEFEHVHGGLAARSLPETYQPRSTSTESVSLRRNSPSSEIEGFALRGKDGEWHWADAKMDGGAVVVRSDEVPEPVGIRYAWADNPICNLYNGAGLPAAPFRAGAE